MPHYSALARGGAGASREPRCPQFVRTTASPDSPRLTPPDLLRAGTSAFQALVLRPRVCGRLCSHTDSTPKHTHRHTHTPPLQLWDHSAIRRAWLLLREMPLHRRKSPSELQESAPTFVLSF